MMTGGFCINRHKQWNADTQKDTKWTKAQKKGWLSNAGMGLCIGSGPIKGQSRWLPSLLWLHTVLPSLCLHCTQHHNPSYAYTQHYHPLMPAHSITHLISDEHFLIISQIFLYDHFLFCWWINSTRSKKKLKVHFQLKKKWLSFCQFRNINSK